MKFDLEILIDQHTMACDRTFEGVPDSRDSHAHYWSEICPIMPNHFNMFKTQISGALLVASGQILKNARQISEFGRQIF